MFGMNRLPALGLGLAFAMGLGLCVDPSSAQEGKTKAKASASEGKTSETKAKKAAETKAKKAAEAEDEKDTAEPKAKKSAAEAKSKAEPKSKKAAEPEASTYRVPRYFGQIGLSEEQREKINGIQAKRSPKIQELRKQAEAEQKSMMDEIETVLTAEQRRKLAGLREGAETKKDSAAAESKK